MSGNAYKCRQCGVVELAQDIWMGRGDWLEVRRLSDVRIVGEELREPTPFCSHACAVAFLGMRVER